MGLRFSWCIRTGIAAFVATLLPTFDLQHATWRCSGSVFAAVGMLGATVMPHVIYLHSALVQPRLKELAAGDARSARPGMLRKYLRFELVDVFVAMNGAWLINSAMIVMAAVAMYKGPSVLPDDPGCVPHAGAAAGARRGGGVCGGAAVLGAVELDGGRDGGAGDYRGISGDQVPDISAAVYYGDSGADRDWGGLGSAEDSDWVAGAAELYAAGGADSAADADERARA